MKKHYNYNFGQKLYCSNCNKTGHIVHHCRYPVISLGVISFMRDEKNKEIKYLIVRRKNTHGFTDFIRGKYSLNNGIHIKKMIDEMTIWEKQIILSKDFVELWNHLWGGENNKFLVEKQYAKEKFYELRRGIRIGTEFINLKILIDKSVTHWEEAEWGFPKGRKNMKESDIECAMREWSEESGYSLNKLNIISNIIPYQEIFIGSNFKTYKQIYYLGKFMQENKNPMDLTKIKFDKIEIGDARWCNLNDCKNLIRPYNLEKIKIIEKIDKILIKYNV